MHGLTRVQTTRLEKQVNQSPESENVVSEVACELTRKRIPSSSSSRVRKPGYDRNKSKDEGNRKRLYLKSVDVECRVNPLVYPVVITDGKLL